MCGDKARRRQQQPQRSGFKVSIAGDVRGYAQDTDLSMHFYSFALNEKHASVDFRPWCLVRVP